MNLLLVQLLNPKIRYLSDSKSLLVMDAFRDTYGLAIHNSKLARERKEIQFLTYLITEFHVGDKVLVRNHCMDV